MDAKNVSAAKPKIGGSVFVAPLGTKLPEDAKSELDTKFNSLGYCSDDGVSNNNSPETDTQKAWGGAVVLNLFSGKIYEKCGLIDGKHNVCLALRLQM